MVSEEKRNVAWILRSCSQQLKVLHVGLNGWRVEYWYWPG